MLILLTLALCQSPGAEAPDYDAQVAPILAELCFDCHGPDQAVRKAGLRLDQRAGALTVAKPGSAAESEILRRITAEDPNQRMPPPESGEVLEPGEIDILRRWIDSGLEYATHWAFVAPQQAALPPATDWSEHPIDRFVMAELQRRGLQPAPPAEPAKLLRRAALDLTGLPPSLDTLDSLGTAPGRAQFLQAVDSWLQGPRRSEQRTLEWLDGARYADTNGYQNDFARHQWPWRDWVLESYQRNQPYDQFVLEQMAGDLLPDARPDQILATGFHRNNRTVTEAGSIDEEWRVENVVDRVETTATVFLGLTMGCARCHDHKYDPVSQREFYGMYAFFNSIDEKGVYQETRGNVAPLITVKGPVDSAALEQLDAEVLLAKTQLDQATAATEGQLEAWLQSWREAPAARLAAPSLHVAGQVPVRLEGNAGAAPNLGTAQSFEQDRAFAISAWVRAESHGAIWSRMAADDTYRGIDLVLLQDRRIAIHLIHDWPENAIKVVTKEPLPLEVWQHLGMSYDGSGKAAGVSLWIGGELVETSVAADTLDGSIQTPDPLRLGTRHNAGHLRGSLADLRIYGTAQATDRGLLRDAWVVALTAAESAQASENSRTTDARPALLDALFTEAYATGLVEARDALASVRARRVDREKAIPTAMVLAERAEPRPTYVLDRGRYDAPRSSDLIEPHVPAMLGSLPADQPADRLALARWMISEQQPLLARVQVNRVWQRFFGRGLVVSTENFGVQGDRPNQRELLDWLSVWFVESGWDQRALERLIVSSQTYAQSSAVSPSAYLSDPHNSALARGPRHRLSAEEIRDSALSAAGLLVERLGGPPTRPYQPEGLWTELAGGAGQGPYVQDANEGLWRRSLYTHRKRTVPHPTLSSLDAPGFEICQVRRARTNTPLQALTLLNDVTYVEAARVLAQAVIAQEPTDLEAQLRLAFRRCTQRSIQADELALLRLGHERRLESFRADPIAAAASVQIGAAPIDSEECTPELAALASTALILLNLDETLTKE
jgi:hypothetical protein